MNKKQAKLSSYWADRPESDDDDVICLSDFNRSSSKVKAKKTKSLGITHSQVSSSSVKSKKCPEWVTPSFDDFLGFGEAQSQSCSFVDDTPSSRGVKRPHSTTGTNEKSRKFSQAKKQANDTLWADKYNPESQSDLAVHKKKIQEVETWLQMNMKKKSQHQPAPILLLTGPTGAGKTATIHVLAKEMRIEVQEWTNPVVTNTYLGKEAFKRNLSDFTPVGGYTSESQSQVFEDFLLRANKYPTLQIFGEGTCERKVILVEDYPNIFFRDTSTFHNILRKYVRTGRSPLVFIMSESAGGESNERLLFPKELQSELAIGNVSFNPVAPTMMMKILSKVANQESSHGAKSFPLPSRTTLDALSASSNGDIRGAINALQFACLKGTQDLDKMFSKKSSSSRSTSSRKSKSSTKSKPDSSDSTLSAIGGKDTSLFLFRALGKILYCKREETPGSSEGNKLPPHLSEHVRNPLAFNPEDVVERCHLSSDMFNAYLHQNYLDFCSDIDDVTRASDYLSLADSITADWAIRSVMNEYSSCVATRGLLHSNQGRTSGSGGGWKPLHKPQWFSVMKQMREKIATAKGLFRGYHWTPEVLQTQLIPYLGLINVTMHDAGQITFLQDINKYGHHRHPGFRDRLDEKDIASLQVEDDSGVSRLASIEEEIPLSQSNKSQPEEEDDIVIEDYESD